jgi:hypothetical protein
MYMILFYSTKKVLVIYSMDCGSYYDILKKE